MSRKYSRAESKTDLLDYLDRGHSANRENRWTFEIAWEAANKVGGIYTVIRSKAFVSTEELGEFYCLFGPYKEHCARTEVEECDFPPGNPLQGAVNNLRAQGYRVSARRLCATTSNTTSSKSILMRTLFVSNRRLSPVAGWLMAIRKSSCSTSDRPHGNWTNTKKTCGNRRILAFRIWTLKRTMPSFWAT